MDICILVLYSSPGKSILKPEKRFSPSFHVNLKHWESDPDWIPHVIPNWDQHFPVKNGFQQPPPLHLKQPTRTLLLSIQHIPTKPPTKKPNLKLFFLLGFCFHLSQFLLKFLLHCTMRRIGSGAPWRSAQTIGPKQLDRCNFHGWRFGLTITPWN